MVRMLGAALFACALVSLTGPALLAQDASPDFDPAQVPLPASVPSARAGAPIFAENCAPCHGETGMADGPTAPELTSPPTAFADAQAIWERSPDELFFTTKFGRLQGMMPPWRNRLNDDQIWNAIAFAWSLHTNEEEVQNGAALYAESCAACHGVSGMGDGPEATEEMANLADAQFVNARSQAALLAGWLDAHPDLGDDWSSEEQAATLSYIRTFSMSPPWVSPYSAGDGVIQGTVQEGADGLALPEGAQVTLDVFLGFEPVATFTTTTTADGAFAFRNLSQDPNLNYIASVGVDGVNYSSDFMTLSTMTPTVSSEITVFGVTDDPTVLAIDRFHWIIESQPGALLVGQVYAVGNTSDRTYVGRTVEGAPEPVTFAMHLPPGAQQVAFDSGALGERFHQVGPVIYDTLPVIPGQATRQVVVRYALPVESADVALSQDLLYPVRDATLLVGELPGLKVETTGLAFDSVQNMGDRAFQLWAGADLPPTSLDVNLTGVLQAGDPDPRADTTAAQASGSATASSATSGTPRSTTPPIEPWVAALVAALVSAVLAGVTFWAWRTGRVRFTYNRGDLTTLRGDLIEQIAHLDDLHALGEVNDNDWLRQRAQLKTQLVDIEGRLLRGRQKEAMA